MGKNSFEEENQHRQGAYPSGSSHREWKGNEASIRAKHYWVRRWKKEYDKGIPNKCEYCGIEVENETNMDCACLIKEAGPDNPKAYPRDIINYAWLCTKCHSKMDHGNEKIRENLIALNNQKYTGKEWDGWKRNKN